MSNKMLSERIIKRDFSSLSIKNEWFWVLVNKNSEEIEILSRNRQKMTIDSIFNKDECYVLDYRNTGVYVISSLPSNSNEEPFCYFKEQPLHLPIAICALPSDLNLDKAETVPLHSALSALESIKIRNNSNLNKAISIKL